MDTFLVHYLPKIVYRFIDHHSVSNEHNLFPLLYNDAQVKRQNSFKVFNAGDTLWNNMLIHMYNIYPVTYTEDRILNYGNPINMGFTKDGRIAYIAVSTETSPNWIFRKEMILSEYRKRRYF
ncbi:hypothetical protein [Lishizhenia tianjinensis]|nr:hypothetical protein [Lishizhenia tianjinensis]